MARLPRLVESKEFERILQLRSRSTTIHFAVHCSPPGSATPVVVTETAPAKLSTAVVPCSSQPVEDLPANPPFEDSCRIGAVVPKRHARRAVTRSLIKRQIYAAAERHRDKLSPDLWIVRLRAPFDRALFPSAGSASLRREARAELDALFEAATRGSGR